MCLKNALSFLLKNSLNHSLNDLDLELCCELAEFFFLDTEFSDDVRSVLAKRLNEAGWTRERTHRTLVTIIAPHVASNIGYGFYPVIGEWAGFDHADLKKRFLRSEKLRQEKPDWWFLLSDWWMTKILKAVEAQKLLGLLKPLS